jgi:hypothetical protein
MNHRGGEEQIEIGDKGKRDLAIGRLARGFF